MNKIEQWWEDFKRLPNSQKIMLGLGVAGAVGLGLYARSKNQAAAGNAGTDSGTGAGSGVGSGVGDTSGGGTTTTTTTTPPPGGGGGDSGGGGGTGGGGGGGGSGGGGGDSGSGSGSSSGGTLQEANLPPLNTLQEANLPPPAPLGFPFLNSSGLSVSNIQQVSAGGRRYLAPPTPTPTGTVLPVIVNQMPLPRGSSITGRVLPVTAPAPTATRILRGRRIAE